jgi:uncharacterized protein
MQPPAGLEPAGGSTRRGRHFIAATLLGLLGLLGIAEGEAAEPQRLRIQVDGVAALVEVAADPESRGQGLMHRRELGADEGMLLVLPKEQPAYLWMLNTHIPLDAGFFDGRGVLAGYSPMQPDGGKQVHASPGPALYVLEMPQGWFDRHGLGPGARLELPFPIQGR